jgi:hypothetical protein
MKNRKLHLLARLATAIALAATVFACSVTLSESGGAPTLSLTADTYSAYSDQDILFSASASDPRGNPIYYSWSIDGITQGGEYGTAISRYWLTAYNISSDITVTATNSQGLSTQRTATVSITPAASLRVKNNSSYPLTEIYVTPNGSSTWGSNYLGSSPLPGGYYYTVVGIPGGYLYDFEAALSLPSGASFDTRTIYPAGLAMVSGNYRDFTITDSSATVSGYSAAAAAKSLAPSAMSVRGAASSESLVDSANDQNRRFYKIQLIPSAEPEGQPLNRQ